MELLIVFAILAAVTFYCFLRGSLEEKRARNRLRQELRDGYGHYETRHYTTEQMDVISRFYQKQTNESFALDDITWNDLNMDAIFAQMNHTQSAAGAEYLYAMLRRPTLSAADLDVLERHIAYLSEQEDERVNLQMALHDLGDTGRYSLHDYLDYLDRLRPRSNTKHYVMLAALVASIALIFANVTLGMAALLVVACINIASYLREKNKALPYLTSFRYIIRMTECARMIEAQPLTAFGEYKMSLHDKINALTPLQKSAGMLFQLNASSGNPLEILFDYVKMLTHIDLIRFNRMVQLVRTHKDEISEMAGMVGYLDAVLAIGAFRASLPYWCVPTLNEGTHPTLHMEEGYHPSLSHPVANSFTQNRGMLLTGSNASGKSTFLKMTAINAILAQTIHTCAAKYYEGSCMRIYTSMTLRDDLLRGESYYMVEIKSLKRIMDAAAQTDTPILCFVDEVLRGTNTVERIAASSQILHQLSAIGAYCFAATHDIELAYLLEQDYDNYHFEEEIKDGDVLFSYRLLEGRAQSRNAIKLLEVIGFSKETTAKAQEMAEYFTKTGEWKMEG